MGILTHTPLVFNHNSDLFASFIFLLQVAAKSQFLTMFHFYALLYFEAAMNGLSVAKQDAIAMVPTWRYLALIKTLLDPRDSVMNGMPAIHVLFP